MMRVKICGVTRKQDALAAVRAGADAVGFQFFAQSARYVTPERATEIRRPMPPFVAVVGVFVNAGRDEILRTVQRVRLDYIQLHGDESPEFVRALSDLAVGTIKTVRVGRQEDLKGLDRYTVEAILLDAKVGKLYGGTGQTFDWSLVHGLRASVPVILAGGLRPENVADAIRVTNPRAVDVCSGVESAPGVKSSDKIRAFVQEARGTASGLKA